LVRIQPGPLSSGGCPLEEAPAFAEAILDVYARLPDPELLHSLTRWVHEQRLEGRTVLVHCEAGQNRSGLLTALYLIRFRGYRPRAAIDLVREKRGPERPLKRDVVRFLREQG
jgi:protein-tyrosine phosphatase